MFLRHSLLSSRGIDHGFGTRIPSSEGDDASSCRQVHGTSVVETVQGTFAGNRPEADGGWTACPGLAVGVWTADCVPVLISDERGEYVAAVHAGWRGTVRGILPEAIRKLRKASGQDISGFFAVIGPSIKSCCYPVGEDVWTEIKNAWPSWTPRDKSTRLDLADLLCHQLSVAGFENGQIGEISLCTMCHPDLFFSHRGMGEKRAGQSMLNFVRRKG